MKPGWQTIVLMCTLISCSLAPVSSSEQEREASRDVIESIQVQVGLAKRGKSTEAAAELTKLLHQYYGKPEGSLILNGLGEIYETSLPNQAIEYYDQSSKYPVPSDPWNFGRQHALRSLARIYERQGRYQDAVASLSKWEISEPCGNGAASSTYERTCKIWELRMHYENAKDVLSSMWFDIESGRARLYLGLGPSVEAWATRIERLAGSRSLSADIETIASHLKQADQPFSRDAEIAELLSHLRYRIRYSNSISNYTTAQLIAELLRLSSARRPELPDGIPALFTGYGGSWREEMIIGRLHAARASAIPLLIKADEKRAWLVRYTLGLIGGKEAVGYLRGRIKLEGAVSSLTDIYYCLLLTRDPDARRLVETESKSGSDGTTAAAASRALAREIPDIRDVRAASILRR